MPAILAHRGASRAAPENTLAAIRAAAAAGAGGIECDVRMTADGVCVLMHDSELRRTTDGTGRVEDTDHAALARLDAGCRHRPAFHGEPVPTLAAALALSVRLGLAVNLEIKEAGGREAALAAAVARTVAAHWPCDRAPPVISSFSPAMLVACAAVMPDVPRGLLLSRPPADWLRRAEAVGAASLHCRHDRLGDAVCGRVVGAGYHLVAYTVDDAVRARRLLGMGVGTIVTNRPEQVRA